MKRTRFALFPVLFVTLLAVSANAEQRSPDATEPIVRELGAIRESLGDLVQLLEELRRIQDVELILRRIELHERRLAPLEDSLRSNAQQQIDTRQSIAEAELWKSQTEREMEEIEFEGIEQVPADVREQVGFAEAELERLRVRLEALGLRQLEMENSLADGRAEIEILDELLQESLD